MQEVGKHFLHEGVYTRISGRWFFPQFRCGLDIRTAGRRLAGVVVYDRAGGFRCRFKMKLQANNMSSYLKSLVGADCAAGQMDGADWKIEGLARFDSTINRSSISHYR